MIENHVSKDLFEQAIKNIDSKLDHIDKSQETLFKKLDKWVDQSNTKYKEIYILENNLKNNKNELVEVKNSIEDILKVNGTLTREVDKSKNDRKWIALIFGFGWTATLSAVHFFVKYKLSQ